MSIDGAADVPSMEGMMTMNARTFCLASGTLLLTLLAAPGAQAQTCADHAAVSQTLADRYGESRQSIGLAADNTVVEVWASLESGTWTITVTRPGGPTCLVASGFAFEQLAEVLPVGEEGA
jgi:hypothetical protein